MYDERNLNIFRIEYDKIKDFTDNKSSNIHAVNT